MTRIWVGLLLGFLSAFSAAIVSAQEKVARH
jgi:hypothetical protein